MSNAVEILSEGADRASRFARGKAIVAYLAVAIFLLHFVFSQRYGYFVDELYYLACSEHLDWGYVDQPPLIAVLTWLERKFFGDSLTAIRLFPAVASGVLVWLTGAITRQLGGKRFAQALAALCVIVAPVYLVLYHLLTMNALEPLLWMGSAYLVIRIVQTGNQTLWLWVGVLAGAGLQNKHSMLFFGSGVVAGLLLTPERRAFRERWIWLGGLIALAIFLPNLIWQVQHGFPTLELLNNVRASGRNVALNSMEFLAQQAILMHPLTLPIWLAGLWWYLRSSEGRPYRVLGWTYAAILACMLILGGRVYYLAPAYPMLFATGAIAVQGFGERRKWAWLKLGYISALAVTGVVLAPMMIPVLPVETYIRYTQIIGFQPPPIETHRLGPLHQLYADQFGWEEMAAATARAYHALPPDVRAKTAIFGNNYGQAGAIDFFGPKYGLPKAIATHQNYYFWGPRDYTGESLLILGDTKADAARVCKEVEEVGEVYHRYSMPYQHFKILHCRGLKVPIEELWPRLKNWS